ncbi:uncharacterized protein LOC111638782 [Centruroides sculpturatus]|uniref:uncharacterized protein LOC111638782 n=1 Tax=Centruroides sculpturatus TaxID=218467 RepID=UPI000C6C943B|nr:uncharacterized protein LOC111638782 [Centruroides sculpturatus]
MADFLYNLYRNVVAEEKHVNQLSNGNIGECLQWILEKYSNSGLIKESDAINFDKPGNRCAYVYLYATSHSCLVARTFEKFRECNLERYIEWMKRLRSFWSFNICSLGAGPGTDIVGILMFFRHRLNLLSGVKVNCTLIDKYSSWKTIFHKIMNKLYSENADQFLNITTEYLAEDLFNCLSGNVRAAIQTADLIIMTKFISAISADNECFDVLKNIFESMKPGAFFLCIDNSGGSAYKIMRNAAREVGLNPIFGPKLHIDFQIGYRLKKVRLDIAEGRKLYGASPQENSKISVVIYEKPNQSNNFIFGTMDKASSSMNAYHDNQTPFNSYYEYPTHRTSSPINTYSNSQITFNSSYEYPSPYCTSSPIYHNRQASINSSYEYLSPHQRSSFFESSCDYSSNNFKDDSLNDSSFRKGNNMILNQYDYPRINNSNQINCLPLNPYNCEFASQNSISDFYPLKENWHSNQSNNFINFEDKYSQIWCKRPVSNFSNISSSSSSSSNYNNSYMTLNSRKRKRTNSILSESNKRQCFRL